MGGAEDGFDVVEFGYFDAMKYIFIVGKRQVVLSAVSRVPYWVTTVGGFSD